jgi:DNA transposition AAA+ family ATPase
VSNSVVYDNKVKNKFIYAKFFGDFFINLNNQTMPKNSNHMTREQKEQVRNALLRYANQFNSQAAAAESLQSVNAVTISRIKNNKWQYVTDHMWQNIARQVGFYSQNEQPGANPDLQLWKHADTAAYLLLRILFGDAQRYAMAYGISIQNGLGKTFCARHFAANHSAVYYICCNENMNRKDFLKTLSEKLGRSRDGNVENLLMQTVEELENAEEPLLIIDDAQKLKDRVLHFLIALYRRLINKCGIVILGNDDLRIRVVEGARLHKEMYEEFYNTIGRRFVTLQQPGPRDVELICRANGINNDTIIAGIKANSGGNMHQVAELILQKLN